MSSTYSDREDRIKAFEESRNNERTYRKYDRDTYRSPRSNNYRHHSPERRSYDKSYSNKDRYQRNDRIKSYDRNSQFSSTSSEPPIIKQKPNFEPSGLLAKESNNIEGIQLKYTEPEDSAIPDTEKYQIYSFKNNATIPFIIDLAGKSSFLIGRESKVVQIQTDHESCSKQHAVIQFRSRPVTDENGKTTNQVKYVTCNVLCVSLKFFY